MADRIEYDHNEFERQWMSGVPLRDMARHFGASVSWVSRQALEKHQLPSRERSSSTLPINSMCAAYVDHKMGTVEIAKRLGVCHTQVARVLKASGVEISVSKLVPGMVAECARLRSRGFSYKSIGKMLGLSQYQARDRAVRALGITPRATPDRAHLRKRTC